MRKLLCSLGLSAALAAGPALAAELKCDGDPDDGNHCSETEGDNGAKNETAPSAGTKAGAGNPVRDTLKKLSQKAQEEAARKQQREAQKRAAAAGQPPGGLNSGKGDAEGHSQENQLAREVASSILDDGNGSGAVRDRVARLQSGGEAAFYGGVVQLATGITQVSLASQDSEEHGPSEESAELQQAGYTNIAQGTQNIEAGRATVAQGNNVARTENSRTSVGASNPLPLKNLSFDRGRATPEANRKLDEMEEKAGVPAATLIAAVNTGGGRDEIVSIAGGAKGMSAGKLYAAIPDFGTSSGPSSGGASGGFAYAGGVSAGAHGSSPQSAFASEARRPAPAVERRAVASISAPAREAAFEGEGLQPLRTEALFGSTDSQDEEGSLFERVKGQYAKRTAELARK